ncbi:MAG: hypothetical protein LBR22_01310, partial [Desulfovibrio sp.]|nr:hypothetical protein [Desulfovibrio sp.]
MEWSYGAVWALRKHLDFDPSQAEFVVVQASQAFGTAVVHPPSWPWDVWLPSWDRSVPLCDKATMLTMAKTLREFLLDPASDCLYHFKTYYYGGAGAYAHATLEHVKRMLEDPSWETNAATTEVVAGLVLDGCDVRIDALAATLKHLEFTFGQELPLPVPWNRWLEEHEEFIKAAKDRIPDNPDWSGLGETADHPRDPGDERALTLAEQKTAWIELLPEEPVANLCRYLCQLATERNSMYRYPDGRWKPQLWIDARCAAGLGRAKTSGKRSDAAAAVAWMHRKFPSIRKACGKHGLTWPPGPDDWNKVSVSIRDLARRRNNAITASSYQQYKRRVPRWWQQQKIPR